MCAILILGVYIIQLFFHLLYTKISYMTLAEQLLIYTLTAISVFITIKTMKTAVVELSRFTYWMSDKVRQIYYMIFPGKEPYQAKTSIGKLFEKSKMTLIPFLNRDHYKETKRKQLMGLGYLILFIGGLLLIVFFFWALFTADIETVVNNSPYLIGSIERFLLEFRYFSRFLSFLFVFGFVVEVFNTIRSLF